MDTSSKGDDVDGDGIDIRPAESADDFAIVRRLFQAHADAIDVDLSFQGFAGELAALPGKYAPPTGRLLIAWRGGEALGCVGLRGIAGNDCEMKRLYVRPEARGTRLGRRLVARICAEARAAGYARIVLDTLPTMRPAIALYRSVGFEDIAPYQFSPVEGTVYLALRLG